MISYLNSARCYKHLTVDDLPNIIHGIARRTDAVETVVDKESDAREGRTDTKYMLEEHVIAYWLEGHIARWYLGIFEAEKSDKLLISYMIHADSNRQSWTFPETAEILETPVKQITSSKVKVQYLGYVRIQCNLVSKILSTEIDNIVNFIEKNRTLLTIVLNYILRIYLGKIFLILICLRFWLVFAFQIKSNLIFL